MGHEMIFGRSGLGFVGLWDAGAIEMTADQLRRRSGELHGELNVTCGAVPVGNGQLHRAAFNFSSSSSRERLAKQLRDRARTGDTIPWADHLEEFCAAILAADRVGQPIVQVGHLSDPTEDGYLLNPFLPAQKTSIVFAAGGTGKSYLAVLCAASVASGQPILGWSLKEPGRVLYLDWETDAYEVNERLQRVSRGLGIATPTIDYRACAGSLDRMAEDISKYVSDRKVKLVIVDSVGMASGPTSEHGGAEESALKLFGSLRFLGTTVLAIDHVTGEDAKSDKAIAKPYGSIYKMNLARSVWELKGTIAEQGQDSHLGLFHRKVNRGRLQPAVGIVVRHEEDRVIFAREDIQDDDLVKGLSHSTRVIRVLQLGSATVAEIAADSGLPEPAVRLTLNRGRGSLFRKVDDHAWGLLQRAVETPVS